MRLRGRLKLWLAGCKCYAKAFGFYPVSIEELEGYSYFSVLLRILLHFPNLNKYRSPQDIVHTLWSFFSSLLKYSSVLPQFIHHSSVDNSSVFRFDIPNSRPAFSTACWMLLPGYSTVYFLSLSYCWVTWEMIPQSTQCLAHTKSLANIVLPLFPLQITCLFKNL